MRELRFDGLSPDGSKLILVGKDGQRWSLAIDERIEAAVRRDRARLSQVEIEQSGVLRPREIQARIRAGATAEDVAAASGLPVEHVRRFEGPVLTERAWVAQQAQATEVRRPGGDIELGDLVAERLNQEGVEPSDVSWDAWRRDDGLWVVIATFPIAPNTHVATWTFDSSSRTMTVVDDNARALSSITGDVALDLVARRPALASVAPLPGSQADDDAAGPEAAQWADEAADTPADDEDEAEDEVAAEPVALEEPAESTAGDVADASHEAGPPGATADEPVADEPVADEPVADVGSGIVADPAEEEEPAQDVEPATDAEDVPLFATPAAAPVPRSSGRSPVPSFDDILFGPGPKRK